MNVFYKIKDLLVFKENQDDFDAQIEQEEILVEEKDEVEEKQVFNNRKDVIKEKTKVKRDHIMPIHPNSQLQIVLVKPEGFEDAQSIADHLKNKNSVLLNLENTSKELARRLVDFLSGVAYANNGQIKRVASSTFMITPYEVDIKSDGILDDLDTASYTEH